MIDYSMGCSMPAEDWANLNRSGVFEDPSLSRYVGPYPPDDLMYNTTGVTLQSEFASHGADFWAALSRASPKALSEYSSVLDFGCGCGRLARMFKGTRVMWPAAISIIGVLNDVRRRLITSTRGFRGSNRPFRLPRMSLRRLSPSRSSVT